MSLSLSIGPLVSLIAGILILVMPRLLSTIVALYLIIMGILGLLGRRGMTKIRMPAIRETSGPMLRLSDIMKGP